MELVELKVEMVGFNSAKKLRKCLSRIRGVERVEVELIKKKVVVRGAAGEAMILKTLRRSGFRCEPWCSKTEALLSSYITTNYYGLCIVSLSLNA